MVLTRGNFFPCRGLLAMPGNISDAHSLARVRVQWGVLRHGVERGQGCHKAEDSSSQQRIIQSKVSEVPRLRNCVLVSYRC